MSKDILLTGFKPFGVHEVNSSWQAAKIVGGRYPDRIHIAELSVEHVPAYEEMTALLKELRPRICLATGLAAGETIRIEREARKHEALAHIEGPALHRGIWDFEDMETRLKAVDPRVVTSTNCGQYICETAYWTLMNFREQEGFPEAATFLHLPPLSEDCSADHLADAVVTVLEPHLLQP